MDEYRLIKNNLKRILKHNNKIRYSLSAVILYLMTGSILSFGGQKTPSDKFSYQVFVNASYRTHKNKDNTIANFNEKMNDDLSEKSDKYVYKNNKFYGGHGIILEKIPFIDYINWSALINVKPIKNVSVVNPDIKNVNVVAPDKINIEIPKIQVELNPIKSVKTVAKTINKAQDIELKDIQSIYKDIQVNKIEIEPHDIVAKTYNVKVKPNILNKFPDIRIINTPFKPTALIMPESPKPLEVQLSVPNELPDSGFLQTISDYYSYWGNGNSGTMLDQIRVTSGKFKATSDKGAYMLGYKGKPGISGTSSYTRAGIAMDSIPSDGFHSLSDSHFMGIRNSAFTEFGKDVEITWFGQRRGQLVYDETGTDSLQTLNSLHNTIGDKLYYELKDNMKQTNIYDNYAGLNLHNNDGKIYLGNSNNIYSATTVIDDNKTVMHNNNGHIIGLNLNGGEQGKDGVNGAVNQSVFYNTPDITDSNYYILSNGKTGKIDLYGAESLGMYFTGNPGRNLQSINYTAFVNNGELNLWGVNSSGVAVNSQEALNSKSGIYLNEPINVYSDNSRGVYLPGNVSNVDKSHMLIKVHIGQKPNDTKGVDWTDIETNKTRNIKSNGNLNGNSVNDVDNAIGVMYSNRGHVEMKTPDITIGEHGKNSIGVLALNGTMNIYDGNITLNGGNKNAALASKQDYTHGGGNINYYGKISINNSNDAIGVYAQGKNITIDGDINSTNSSGVTLFADNGNILLQNKTKIKVDKGHGDSVIAFSKGSNGRIDLNKRKWKNYTPDLELSADNNKGVGLFSMSGGYIDANNINLNVNNAIAGIASIGNGSKVDFKNGVLKYNGSNYGIYTQQGGTVDISNSFVYLKGKSIGFDIDADPNSSQDVIMDSKTRIIPESDDVSVFNLKHANNLSTIGGIKDNIIKIAQDRLNKQNHNVDLSNLLSKAPTNLDPGTFYKVAAIDGGKIEIGTMINSVNPKDDFIGKSNDPIKNAKKEGFQFYNRFNKQRLIATTKENSTITSVLTTDDATRRYKNVIFGLEMNSSDKATSLDDSQINVVKSKIIADRIGDGLGGVGAYISYGKVNVDKDSTIDVELINDGKNTPNEKGVGIYSTNGSHVTNNGVLTIGGKNAVGMYNLGYRIDENNKTLVEEFGKKSTPYESRLENNGTITLKDEDSIGIFSNNNKNNDKYDLVLNNGTINLKKNGIGIYAINSTVKTLDKSVINLDGGNGIGIYSKNNKLDKQDTIINTNGNNNIGLYLDGDIDKTVVVNKDQKIKFNIEPNSTNNIGMFINLDSKNKDDIYDIRTDIVSNNPGLIKWYTSKSNANIDFNSKIENGDIGLRGEKLIKLMVGKIKEDVVGLTVGNNSIGVYGYDNDIDLNRQLEITDSNAIGIYNNNTKLDKKKTVLNNSVVFKNSINGIGTYQSESTVNSTNVDELFKYDKTSKNNVGMYLNQSDANLNNIHSKLIGENKNIDIYATNYSSVNMNKLTVENTDDTSAIGLYLDTSSCNVNNINATKNTIGIYSKVTGDEPNKAVWNHINTRFENNKELNIDANGDKAIGIYNVGSIELGKTNISVNNNGIGIYNNAKGGNWINTLNDTTNTITFNGDGIGIYSDSPHTIHDDNSNINFIIKDNAKDKFNKIGYVIKSNDDNNTKRNNQALNISQRNGDNITNVYVKDSSRLTNAKGTMSIISDNKDNKNNINVFVENSNFVNKANMNILESKDSHNIYIDKGNAINETTGVLSVTNTTNDTNVSTNVVSDGKLSTFTNKGKVIANGNTVGVYSNNGNIINDGVIESKSIDDSKAISVVVNGKDGKFTNNKDIISDYVGLYVNKVSKDNIVLNNQITLNKSNSVAVYSRDSNVDFNIKGNTTDKNLENIISLYAVGNTNISGTITTSNSKNAIGVYVKDSTVKFNKGSNVIIQGGDKTHYSTGVYTDKHFSGDLNVDINSINPYSIGVRLGDKSKVSYTGNMSVGKDSIGLLVEHDGELNVKDSTFNISNGTGVYINNNSTIGIKNVLFNLSNNGVGLYKETGKITLTDDIKVTGKGTLLQLKNADSDINTNISINGDNRGIIAEYDDKKDHNITINNDITLHDDNANAIAINNTNSNVVITNNAQITSENKGLAVYLKNAKLVNNNNIDTKNGVYLTNHSVLDNKGTIKANGKGVIGYDLDGDITLNVGKIVSGEHSKSNQIGVYIKNDKHNIVLDNADINLVKSQSKGIVLDGVSNFNINNSKISIDNDSVANVITNSVGEISNANISLGESSLGVYANNSTLSIQGNITTNDKATKTNTIYATNKSNVKLDINDINVSQNGTGLIVDNSKIESVKKLNINANSENGKGVYITNNGTISDNISINVSNGGIGAYIKGKANKLPVINSIVGNNSKSYVLDSMIEKMVLKDISVKAKEYTGQIGVLTLGTGQGIDIDNISVEGSKNYGIYNTVNHTINAKNISIDGDNSIGIYSNTKNTTNVLNSTQIKNKGVAIYSVNGEVNLNSDSNNISDESIGVYNKDGIVNINSKSINLDNNSSIGVKANNSKINVNNELSINNTSSDDIAHRSMGIIGENKSNVVLNNTLSVGNGLIGVLNNNDSSTTINKQLNILDNSIGVMSNDSNIVNKGIINVNNNSVGLFGEKSTINSNNTINVKGNNGIGILGSTNSNIDVNNDINIDGNNSIGVYSKNSNIVTKSNINVLGNDSIGIHSLDSDKLEHVGNITVKNNSVGIYNKNIKNGIIKSDTMDISNKSYGIYSINDNKNERSVLDIDVKNTILGKESLGLYSKNNDVNYLGDIVVGESNIAKDGYKDYTNNLNSVGIYADDSTVNYKGTLTVDKPLSVGIYTKGQTNVNIKAGSVINVSNGAIGIMTDEKSKGVITVEKGAEFNISGKATDVDKNATKSNISYGAMVFDGTFVNNGIFNVSNGATGLYYDYTSKFINNGTFKLSSGAKDVKHTEFEANIAGKMVVNALGDITLKIPNGKDFINRGVLDVDGHVNLNNLVLDLSPNTHVDADSYDGVAMISPKFSKGNNVEEYIFKDIFRPKKDGIGKFVGDVKSQSLSWIAKVGKINQDKLDKYKVSEKPSKTRDIIMARIPYNVLLKGHVNEKLGESLDQARLNIAKNMSSKVFQELDSISDRPVFTNSVANIRGDVYANTQERIINNRDLVGNTRLELINAKNKTKKSNKLSLIFDKSTHKDDTVGVSSYKSMSYGALYVLDLEKSDTLKYGGSLGLLQSRYTFDGATSKDSKETITSGSVGLHVEKKKNKFSYLGELVLGYNKHSMNRASYIVNNKHSYDSKYSSINFDLNNKLTYTYTNKNVNVKPYVKLDINYLKVNGFKETTSQENTLALDFKGISNLEINPKLGLDIDYTKTLNDSKYIKFLAHGEFKYHIKPIYSVANEVKFNKSTTYYKLSKPGYRQYDIDVMGGLEYGKENKWSIKANVGYNYGVKGNLAIKYEW